MDVLGRKKRILVVEDSIDDADLIIEALVDYRDMVDIDVVGDGEQALSYLHARDAVATGHGGDPCLILLDIKMPRVDGIEVLRSIKSDARTGAIPVVIFTSSREPRDVRDSYRCGANGYVVKSIGFGEFATAVKKIGSYWLDVNEPPPSLPAR